MKTRKKNRMIAPGKISAGAFLLLAGMLLFSCSSGSEEGTYYDEGQEQSTATVAQEAPAIDDGKGIGPVKEVVLEGGVINEELAKAGEQIYDGKCSACHQLTDQKVVGPGLAGVTERRKPEWVMNMIVNPEEMTKKDPEAKKLLAEHLTQMTNQNVTEEDARAILEYLRKNDQTS